MVAVDEDFYALLQVPPDASQEEIAAAYGRLRDLYSPERLQGGPAEFEQLAARRREELQRAFSVLQEPERRAAYDRARSPAPLPDVLDFRPLPPARRRERPSPSIPLPAIDPAARSRRVPRAEGGGQRGRRSVVAPLLFGSAMLALLLLLVLSGVRTQSGRAALATPPIPNLALPYTEAQVREARTRAEGSRDPEAWVALGNMLFDNMETMRERAPLSPQYLNALPRWIEVTQTYSRALELGAGPAARADLAISRFYYGLGTNDQASVAQAVAEAEQARASGPDDPRVLMNYGLILVGLNPPREREAVEAWRHLVAVAPQSFEAQRARELIAAYGQ